MAHLLLSIQLKTVYNLDKQDFIDWLKDLPFEWISFRYLTENGFGLSHVTVVDELKEDQNAEV